MKGPPIELLELFLYQILPKNDTHFYTRATNFKQNFLKIHIILQNCEAFKQISKILVSDWWNWA